MKIIYKKWNNIKDVPDIILNWTQEIGGKDINVNDVNELVFEYHQYIAKLDESEQHAPTID